MNKAQAQKIAERMVRHKCTGFAGHLTVCQHAGQKVTHHASSKVLAAFWQLIENNPDYPGIEQMYAAEKLGKNFDGEPVDKELQSLLSVEQDEELEELLT